MTLEISVLEITTTFVERCYLYCRLFGTTINKKNANGIILTTFNRATTTMVLYLFVL
jgi:hypothetical protein